MAGTAVLVMTDVEGSSRLWAEHPAGMNAAMARHHAIVHGAVTAHGGWRPVDQGEGDAVFAAFDSAPAAVAAVADFQQQLAAEPWPSGIELRVRVGMHAGDVITRDGNLFGPTVNRCARLRGLGAGGQVLLSAAAFELVRDRLPDGVSVLDLGEHRMKDLSRPEHVYQLVIPGLPADFPPLASLDRARHNLPVQTSSFLGRTREIAELVDLVRRERLVTIVGFGGMGKTRLALQVAAELADGNGDGVWFVDLSAVTESEQVPAAIATVLSIRETQDDGMLGAAIAALRSRSLLLVLDNLEQLLPKAAEIVNQLIRACPELRILATSRAPLRLSGEQEYALASLPLPPVPRSGTAWTEGELRSLSTYDAVTLFLRRAAAVHRDFTLSPTNAAAIAAICAHLDGMPLAIELAAAWTRLLSPEALLSRLDKALTLLTNGVRDVPARHQTLRATITWSYDLLKPDEQELLDRLSVLPGTFTLDAAEAICGSAVRDGEQELDVLDGLGVLVDRSLVRHQAGTLDRPEDRYDLLVSIRDYAGERLGRSGGARTLADRHADYYAQLTAYPPGFSLLDHHRVDQVRKTELHHLRAALAHARASGTAEREAALASHTTTALMSLGFDSELGAVVEHALQRDDSPNLDRVTLLLHAGATASRVGALGDARGWMERAVSDARSLNDPSVMMITFGQSLLLAGSREKFDEITREGEALIAVMPRTGLIPRWYVEEAWTRVYIWSDWSDPLRAEQLLRRMLVNAPLHEKSLLRLDMARALRRQNRREEALTLLAPYESGDEVPHTDPWILAWAPVKAAEARLALGDLETAQTDLELAEQRLQNLDRPDLTFMAACYRSTLDRLRGDYESAALRLRELIADSSDGWLRARAQRLLAVVRRLQGDASEAAALLQHAWSSQLRDGESDTDDMLLCLLERAQQLQTEDPREAVRLIGLVTRRRPIVGTSDAAMMYDTDAMLTALRALLGERTEVDILASASTQSLPDQPDWSTAEETPNAWRTSN